MPESSHLSLKRDQQGRLSERSLRLTGQPEIRRYAYDAAGRLARVTDGNGALCESYTYDHQGRRLADINPQRFRGERATPTFPAIAWARPGRSSTATTARASAT